MSRLLLAIVVCLAACTPSEPDPDREGTCADDPCANGATCREVTDGFFCECVVGYEGDTCEVNTDDCADDPCFNGGTCNDAVDGYTCACAAGYEGTQCQVDIDDCADDPCENGAACIDRVDDVECACVTGYTGDLCETNIDDCFEGACANGGTCVDGVAAYTCDCAPGYEGTTCETELDECAPEPCAEGEQCRDLVADYSCCLVGNASGPLSTDGVVSEFGVAVGFRFVPDRDLEVTRLGVANWAGRAWLSDGFTYIDYTGLSADVKVRLLDVEDIVAEATVLTTSPLEDDYRWVDITPVILTAGESYGVMGFFPVSSAYSSFLTYPEATRPIDHTGNLARDSLPSKLPAASNTFDWYMPSATFDYTGCD